MRESVAPVDGSTQAHCQARRHPWIAGLLSCLTLGLGHVYNGQLTKGLLIYGLSWVGWLAALAILRGLPVAPWNIAIPVLMVVAGYLYVILEAVLTARRQGHVYALKAYNKWYLYPLILVLAQLISMAPGSIFRTMVGQAFKLSSGSMEETLLVGDHILVSTSAYQGHDPVRGDIIVFPFPRDPSRSFIERVVGRPGERVEVRNHRVYINGDVLKEPYVKLDEQAALHTSRYSHWGPEVVPPGKLFVLGDHRDNSADSRDWGFLDRTWVMGRVYLIYWSRDHQEGIRWGRIGRRLD